MFSDSLAHLGVLALGRKESIKYTSYSNLYAPLDEQEKLYRRVR